MPLGLSPDAPPLDTAPAAVSPAPRACLNCGATLHDAYCGACGQLDLPVDPSLRELVGEAWDAFVSVDGKVLSSLRLLLLHPGALTLEYLHGRRARYIPPLRLYLVCSVAYFLVSSLVPEKPDHGAAASFNVGSDTVRLADGASARDTATIAEAARARVSLDSIRREALVRHRIPLMAGVLDSTTRAKADSVRLEEQVAKWKSAPAWMRKRLTHGISTLQTNRKGFGEDYKTQLPRLMFVLMPVAALLLAAAYHSRHRRYPVHLIVALHLHAFVFAIFAVDEVRNLVPISSLSRVLKIAIALWSCAYLPLALRRVYRGRLRYATLRTLAVLAGYSIVGAAAFSLMAFALLLTY